MDTQKLADAMIRIRAINRALPILELPSFQAALSQQKLNPTKAILAIRRSLRAELMQQIKLISATVSNIPHC